MQVSLIVESRASRNANLAAVNYPVGDFVVAIIFRSNLLQLMQINFETVSLKTKHSLVISRFKNTHKSAFVIYFMLKVT